MKNFFKLGGIGMVLMVIVFVVVLYYGCMILIIISFVLVGDEVSVVYVKLGDYDEFYVFMFGGFSG